MVEENHVIIGVTELTYTAPGAYVCNLCEEEFNDGNRIQHLTSSRHRVNVSHTH